MAVTRTTLASAMSMEDTSIKVTSATGFALGNLIRIDNEWFKQTAAPVGTVVQVSRGRQGSAQVAHNVLAAVVTGLGTDFPEMPDRANVPIPPRTPLVVYYGANAAIVVPEEDTIVVLNKATAATMTLAAPSQAQDGLRLTITSATAAAHVVTATTLVGDGVSGSPHTTVTFAAFIGATITLLAVNGIWNQESTKGVTVT